MIRDITLDLPIPPLVSIDYTYDNLRDERDFELVTVLFESSVQDTDSYSFSYHWDFGDGHTSNDQHPIHQYENAGTMYTVTLYVEGPEGKARMSKVWDVMVR